jgi:hypothetical protein
MPRPRIPLASILYLLSAIFSAQSHAATDKYWIGPDNGLWSDPNNWSLTPNGPGGAGPPAGGSGVASMAGDNAHLNPSTTSNYFSIFDATYAWPSNALNNVTVNGGNGFITTLQQTDGAFAAQNLSIGAGGVAILNRPGTVNRYSIQGTPDIPATLFLQGDVRNADSSSISNAYVYQSAGTIGGVNGVMISGNTNYYLTGGGVGGDALFISGNTTFNQSGGGAGAYFDLKVTSPAIYNLSGGTVGFNNETVSTFNQSGGVNNLGNGGWLQAGTYSLSGGTVNPGVFIVNHYTQSGGTASTSNTFALNAGTLPSNRASLSGGTLAPALFSLQSGIFQQSGGTLTVGANCTVSPNATLVSTAGILSCPHLDTNGTFKLAPAVSTTLAIYEQSSTGNLDLELDGTTPNLYAHLSPTSSASLAGLLTIDLASNFSPELGDTFLLLDTPSLTGAFSSYILPPLNPGLQWQPAYTPTSFSLTVVVPEPSAFLLLPSLLLLRRRRLEN